MRPMLAAVSALALTACGMNGTDRNNADNEEIASAESEPTNLADSMASSDPAPGETYATDLPDPEDRPIMQAQVVLDRVGFGPGVIDGKMGLSTTNALEAFQESRDIPVTGELDEATKSALSEWDNIPATRVVTIPREWASVGYKDIPDDPAEQAKMDRLGYESLDEKLAERFHTTIDVLQQLNPGGRPAGASEGASPSPSPTRSAAASSSATPSPDGTESASESMFTAGQQIRVPNIGADRIAPNSIQDRGWQETLASLGVGTEQPEVVRIVVDESEKWLRAYDSDDKLVAAFTVTSGSSRDPLPIGDWGITGVGRNPPFSYQPDLFWDVPDSEEEQQLPPGPNGPVGVVWIDLTKEHYGIHGTGEPQTIGRAQSHGCVRLTNWDAARLAGMVNTQTKVIFQT